jgi:hypothetical protein
MVVSAGVDLVYMLMSIIGITFRGFHEDGPAVAAGGLILAQNCNGVALDCVTLVLIMKERRAGVRVLALLHALMFVASCTLSFIIVAVVRLLIVFFCLRVRSILSVLTALFAVRWSPRWIYLPGSKRGCNVLCSYWPFW